jgi:uncharacterized membrane protein YgcG
MRRIVLALLFFALPAFGQRSLYWDAIHVKAHLDADGRLRVVEEQTYVFNGDWNGGERGFDLREGQTLQINSLHRRDAGGTLVPMSEGSLDVKDGWQLNDTILRWRARAAGEPPFQATRITYVIDYTLSHILVKLGSGYRLDHDFLFSKRPGPVRDFTVQVTLDPVWRTDDPLQFSARNPEGGYHVDIDLEYLGTNAPAAGADPRVLQAALIALVIVFPLFKWRRLVSRERKLGRFEPLVKPTMEWIETNVLRIRPEVVGATWDESIESNEVSALIARWAAEGRVTTKANGSELTMTLKANRDDFEGYERELVDKLFFSGDTTSTSAIKTHYRQSGFNPTAILTPGVRKDADALLPQNDPAPLISLKLPSLALFAAAIYFAKQMADVNAGSTFFFFVLMVVALICWFAAWVTAAMWRGRIDQGYEETKPVRYAIGFLAAITIAVIALDWFELPGRLALVAATLFTANFAINAAKSKKGPAAIAYRKRLASVRQYFIDELKRRDPAIDDRWVPYLIAFGLDKEASAWMRDFGGAATQSASSSFGSSSSSWSSSSSGSSTPRWTGGGGAFGGAGATGGWSAAAAGLAAGVAAPSSSGGSSSGGGGGSSSSGGGSGGGW